MLVAKAPGNTWKESDDGVIHVSGRSVPSIGSIVIPYPGADLKSRGDMGGYRRTTADEAMDDTHSLLSTESNGRLGV